MSNRPRAPLFATINVTTGCNLECPYCFMQPRSNDLMTHADFERVVEELAAIPVFFVNLSGGEPFTHPELCEFLRLAHRRFGHVMVLSNGTLLWPKHLAAIREILQEKGAFSIQVSLDAVDPEVNRVTRTRSSQAILANIETLSELGAHVIVATVVTRINASQVLESIRALSRHTRYFHLMTVQDVRRAAGVHDRYHLAPDEEMALWSRVRELAEEKDLVINTPLNYEGYRGCAEGAPCMAAFSHLVIDPSLEVRPCDRLVDVVLGDLHQQSLEEIWNSPAVRPILTSTRPYCRQGQAAQAC